jgi:hypothetical protein
MRSPSLKKLLLFFISLFILSSCATEDKSKEALVTTPTIKPKEFKIIDPDNKVFAGAVQQYLNSRNAPANSRYEITRIDLDGDGRREGLVHLVAPYSYWCNQYGCTISIFKANNYGFTKTSEIYPIRGPIIVHKSKTNGWKDLIVKVQGKSLFERSKNVVLKFNGKGYPIIPDKAPEIYAYNRNASFQIFP